MRPCADTLTTTIAVDTIYALVNQSTIRPVNAAEDRLTTSACLTAITAFTGVRAKWQPPVTELGMTRGGDAVGRLEGKIAVVTGAGSGIGQEAARAFAREGAVVGLLDRNAPAVEATVQEIDGSAFPLVTDVTDEASIVAAFDEVRRRHGRLDVLYTCAAVQLIGEDAPVHELDIDVWQRTHDVNLRGVYLTCKHGVRLMMESGEGGSIINAGSPTGLTMCGAGWHAYSSSKAGVMALTRIMAADYAPYGIRVNGIVPGTIETTLTKPLLEDPEVRAKLQALHPIGRVGTPQDMAGIAVFLASDESAFATGSHFHVDGGISVR
jgi:NAD(P)-dependent dehydrogenase (short-subunit alcohol dehydrogenase family)